MRWAALFLVLLTTPASAQVAEPGALLGLPAPPIAAVRAHGSGPTRVDSLRGRVVVIVFFSTHCGSCGRAMRELDRLEREHPDLEVIAVTQESAERLAAVMEVAPVSITVAIDRGGRTFRAYRARVLPSFFLLDRTGIVRHVHVGGSAATVRQVEDDALRMLGPPR